MEKEKIDCLAKVEKYLKNALDCADKGMPEPAQQLIDMAEANAESASFPIDGEQLMRVYKRMGEAYGKGVEAQLTYAEDSLKKGHLDSFDLHLRHAKNYENMYYGIRRKQARWDGQDAEFEIAEKKDYVEKRVMKLMGVLDRLIVSGIEENFREHVYG